MSALGAASSTSSSSVAMQEATATTDDAGTLDVEEQAVQDAFELWSAQYPEAAREGTFFGRVAARAEFEARLRRLRVAVGPYGKPISISLARQLIASEPAVLFAPTPRRIFGQMGLELTGKTMGGRGITISLLKKHPALLMVPLEEVLGLGPALGSAEGLADLLATPVERRLQEAPVSEDEPAWEQPRSNRNVIIDLGKKLKPIGGAKAIYPIVLGSFYLLACVSDYLRTH